MRAQNKAPAAWQGHAGLEGIDTQILPNPGQAGDGLVGVIRDVAALQAAGAWTQAQECAWAAFHEWQHTRQADGIGTEMAVELLAGDVSKLLGIDCDMCRAVAHSVLLGSRARVMAGELRAQAAALAEPTARTNAAGAASSAIVVRRGGRKYGR